MLMKKNTPTQEIARLPGETRAKTGEYAAEHRKDFMDCLGKVFFDISRGAHDGKSADVHQFLPSALECQGRYFQAMKGATNITEATIEKFFRNECEKQKRFYKKLNTLQSHFKKKGVVFTIERPVRDRAWDTGLTVGCYIRAATTSLFAFPCVSATGQGNVVFVDDDCAIVFPIPFPAAIQPYQSPHVWTEEFGKRTVAVPLDFSEAALFYNFLFVRSGKQYSSKELDGFLQKYGVVAVVLENEATHETRIYTGGVEDLSPIA